MHWRCIFWFSVFPSTMSLWLNFHFSSVLFYAIKLWLSNEWYSLPLGLAYWVLAWDVGVCSSQGLRFDSPWCQFRWASPYKVKKTGFKWAPQVGGGIGPLGLVCSWAGYRVFKKKSDTLCLIKLCLSCIFLSITYFSGLLCQGSY
jgi:hypothetical protein